MELTRKNIYILISTIVLALILLTIFLVIPLVQEIYSLSEQVKAKNSKLSTSNLKLNNLKNIKDSQMEVKNNLDTLSGSLISGNDSLSLILPLEKIAEQTNVKQTINILNSSTEENDKEKNEYKLDDYPYTPVTIKIQGKYKNIVDYCINLENVGFYTDITLLKISAPSEKRNSTPTDEKTITEEDSINMTIKLRVFTKE